MAPFASLRVTPAPLEPHPLRPLRPSTFLRVDTIAPAYDFAWVWYPELPTPFATDPMTPRPHRTPTHWGLEPTSPLARLLPRIEPRDVSLVIGSGAEAAAYLLAAHDAVVTFLAGDLGCVERVESRMATEALGSMFEGYVAQAGPTV